MTKQKVSVSVDGSTNHASWSIGLGHREGAIGLWVDSMPAAFRNLRIQPAKWCSEVNG